jgi:hypothetical protein
MAASLRGREPRSRGTSTVESRYQAVQWIPWLGTLVCMWKWYIKWSHEMWAYKSNIQSLIHVTISHLYHACYMSQHPIPFHLVILIALREKCKLWSSPLSNFKSNARITGQALLTFYSGGLPAVQIWSSGWVSSLRYFVFFLRPWR